MGREREKERERESDEGGKRERKSIFKELINVIVEARKSKIFKVGQQARDPGKS